MILIFVCLCPSSLFAEDVEEAEEAGEPPQAPLSLRVFFRPGDYHDNCGGGILQGDMLVVVMAFKNQSAVDMALKVPMYPHSSMLSFQLRTSNGMPVSQVEWQGPPEDAEVFSLWPGREEQIEYTLSPYLYPLSLAPGSYVLSATYKDGNLSAQSPDFAFPVVAEQATDEDGVPIESDTDEYLILMKIAGTAQFVEAVRADPSYSYGGTPPLPVLFELIRTLRGLGRYDEAISECWNVLRQCRHIRRDERYILRWTIAECHYAKGEVERAIKELLKFPGKEARKRALEWGWKPPAIAPRSAENSPGGEAATKDAQSQEPPDQPETSATLEAIPVSQPSSPQPGNPQDNRTAPSGPNTARDLIVSCLAYFLALVAGMACGALVPRLVRHPK